MKDDDLSARRARLSASKQALLEQRIRGKPSDAHLEASAGIAPRPAGEDAPLSFSQLAVWFHQRLQPSSTIYNVSFAASIEGALHVSALTESLEALMGRHATLRTVFRSAGDEPVQHVLESVQLPLRMVDLSGAHPSLREERLQKALKAEVDTPFDVENGPLVRFVLYTLKADAWVLSMTMQHLATDGWSFGVFARELSLLYSASLEGRKAMLSPLPITYADYAYWQRRTWLDSPGYKEHLRYWKGAFDGTPPLLELATDFPRPGVNSYRGDWLHFSVDAETTAALRHYCKSAGLSLFMIVLASLRVLLCRYTGQSDIVIGFPAANRQRRETEGLIGDFINTIALRTILAPETRFETALETIRNDTLNALAHQEYPFEHLVRDLHPQRSASYHPVFQVMLVYQNTPPMRLELPGCKVAIRQTLASGSLFDLILEVHEVGDELICRLAYNTDLFRRETAARMAEHFGRILRACLGEREKMISEIPLMDSRELQRVLGEWNATAVEYPREKCMHQLVREQAQRTPDAAAIVCEGQRLTYRQLMAAVERVAGRLRGMGVGPGRLVGVCLERSVEMAVAILAVLEAGGAYVPLDPGFPPERLGLMVEDAGCVAILTQASLAGRLPRPGSKIAEVASLLAREESGAQSAGAAGREGHEAGAEDLAYVIYTSGSTGRPKGVEIPHRAVVNFLCSMQREPGLSADDNLLSVTTMSFDIFGLELFLPLVTGACTTIVTRETALDGRQLRKALEKSGATVMQATPATWRLLLESGWSKAPGLKVLCGGEALSRELADRILETGAELWNMYGPTETTIWSAVGRVEQDGKPISIGKPIANTQLHVLDARGNVLPIGVPGELHIGGDGLARGYRGRQDLTGSAFIRDPFRGEGARLYRTGDLVRRTEDGAIQFLGRIDTQVKLRGHRIELGEIEFHLNQHTEVRNSVVVVREDGPDLRRLVAYYIPRGELRPSVGDFRKHLAGTLPDYMIPGVYVSLPEFPLTPNAKIDRKALPRPEPREADATSEYMAPRDETETELARLWGTLLGRQRVSITDNFFDLGGDSLLAARLFTAIGKRLGKNLPLATLFTCPTIEGIAAALRGQEADARWSVLVPIHPEGTRPPLFLVHGAEGNVLLYRSLQQRLADDQPVYGLQSEGLDGRQDSRPTIESMATTYVEAIRRVQPQGPYFLGGFCMGGTVAFEMARQLRDTGAEVALVAMFETYNMERAGFSQGRIAQAFHAAQNGLFHLLSALPLDARDRSLFLNEKGQVARTRLGVRFRAMRASLKSLIGEKAFAAHRDMHVRRENDSAQQLYHPRSYDGRLTLFRPKRFFSGYPDWEFGWGGVPKGGIDVHVLPIYPRTMMVEPFVRLLARELESCMCEATHSC
jgi:amino acid adenylation domain-containing protein